ncbi:MAG: GtrA family protein [Actinobacteria bacterium]|nr:GtrA family protein [Actinomycetota bacterium]
MDYIDNLYRRFRLLIHEGFKFLVIGGIGTVITIAGAIALQGLGEYVATTIATIAATVFTFLGNRHWTFGHRQGQGARQEGIVFFVLNGVGLLIYYGCIWIMHDLMGLEGRFWLAVALIVGTGLGTLFRFWSYRKWVWALPQPQLATAGVVGYAESPLIGNLSVRPTWVSRPAPTRRPPGRTTARHAAPHRTPYDRITARGGSRPGAHRRTSA